MQLLFHQLLQISDFLQIFYGFGITKVHSVLENCFFDKSDLHRINTKTQNYIFAIYMIYEQLCRCSKHLIIFKVFPNLFRHFLIDFLNHQFQRNSFHFFHTFYSFYISQSDFQKLYIYPNSMNLQFWRKQFYLFRNFDSLLYKTIRIFL